MAELQTAFARRFGWKQDTPNPGGGGGGGGGNAAAAAAASVASFGTSAADVSEIIITVAADDGTARMIDCTLTLVGVVAEVVPFGRAVDTLLSEVTETLKSMNVNDKMCEDALEKLMRVHRVVDQAVLARQRKPGADVSSFQEYVSATVSPIQPPSCTPHLALSIPPQPPPLIL